MQSAALLQTPGWRAVRLCRLNILAGGNVGAAFGLLIMAKVDKFCSFSVTVKIFLP
jgi:hypothetical protein